MFSQLNTRLFLYEIQTNRHDCFKKHFGHIKLTLPIQQSKTSNLIRQNSNNKNNRIEAIHQLECHKRQRVRSKQFEQMKIKIFFFSLITTSMLAFRKKKKKVRVYNSRVKIPHAYARSLIRIQKNAKFTHLMPHKLLSITHKSSRTPL